MVLESSEGGEAIHAAANAAHGKSNEDSAWKVWPNSGESDATDASYHYQSIGCSPFILDGSKLRIVEHLAH